MEITIGTNLPLCIMNEKNETKQDTNRNQATEFPYEGNEFDLSFEEV